MSHINAIQLLQRDRGSCLTINEAGLYTISYSDRNGGGAAHLGVSLNSASLTMDIHAIAGSERIAYATAVSGDTGMVSVTLSLAPGDVIRPHTDGTPNNSIASFRIVQLAKL